MPPRPRPSGNLARPGVRRMNATVAAGFAERPLVMGWLWLVLASSSVVAFEPAPYDLLGLGLLAGLLLLGLRVPLRLAVPLGLLGLFLLGNIVAGMVAEHPAATLAPIVIRHVMVAFWLLFAALIAQGPVRVIGVLFNGYAFAAVISVILGSLGYFRVLPAELLLEAGRVKSLFKDSNVYGPFLVPVALWAFASLVRERSGLRAGALLALFLTMALGIMLSFSRGSWVNFAISMTLFFALSMVTSRTETLRNRLVLIGGLVLVLGVVFVVWAGTRDRVLEMLQVRAKLVQYYDLAEGGRFSVQSAALEASARTPLGIGPGQSNRRWGLPPHNVYLHVLVEAGWLGALGFYAFLALTLGRALAFCWRPWALQGVYIAMFACTVGTLTQSLFIDSTHWRHLWVLFALLWGPMAAASARAAPFPRARPGRWQVPAASVSKPLAR